MAFANLPAEPPRTIRREVRPYILVLLLVLVLVVLVVLVLVQ